MQRYKWVGAIGVGMASNPVRTRKNRRDTSQSLSEAFLGAMVSATAYNGNVQMVDVHAVAPGSAEFAGRLADGLLPTEE